MLCRQESAAANAGTKRPRSQDETGAADSINGSAETPAAMATVDAAMSETAEIAAVAAAIAATDRADTVLHNVGFTSLESLVLKALLLCQFSHFAQFWCMQCCAFIDYTSSCMILNRSSFRVMCMLQLHKAF